jgi:hypothetical protein
MAMVEGVGPFDVVVVSPTDLAYQLLQCQQVLTALIAMFGTESEDGKYIDIPWEFLEDAWLDCKVLSAPLLDIRTLRLLKPLAQEPNGEAAPPTTQNGLQNGRCVE